MVRTRFCPSPTGFIHIGSVYSALLDYAFAKKHKGKFIIRVEDTDRKRFVSGAEEKVYEGLAWFGIEADESPQVGGPYGPYRQSERLSIYQKYARVLIDKNLAYYCFCSPQRLARIRKMRQKKGLPPMYDRHCRKLDTKDAKERIEKGEKFVIRMKIPKDEKIIVFDLIRGEILFDSKVVDDQVLLKSDGFPTYHLAVVVDDYLMKITHIVRGEEWISSAPKHVLLYQFFNWPMPLLLHTPTIREATTKKKLSKRMGHASISWYQENGYLPETILNFLFLLGWSHPQEKEIFSIKEFIKHFDLKDLSPVGPIFDLKKLNWMNGVYIRRKTDKELFRLMKPFAPKGMNDSLIRKTIPLVKERMVKLSDYPDLVDFLMKELKIDKKILIKKGGGDVKLIKKQLSAVSCQLSRPEDGQPLAGVAKLWQAKALEKLFRDLAAKNSWHVGKFFMATRIALTGKTVTPPLFESMALLGKEKSIKRLKGTVKILS